MDSPNLATDFGLLIADATDSAELLRLQNVELPHLIGITDDERAGLKSALGRRFAQLNAAALGPQIPRWS